MYRYLYYDQVTWLPLRCTVKSFREIHSHTMLSKWKNCCHYTRTPEICLPTHPRLFDGNWW